MNYPDKLMGIIYNIMENPEFSHIKFEVCAALSGGDVIQEIHVGGGPRNKINLTFINNEK